MPTPALDCLSVVRELWDYLDGELDAERWEVIRAHLASCTGCHDHVEFCRSFLTHVSATPVDEAEVSALRERVVVALRSEL